MICWTLPFWQEPMTLFSCRLLLHENEATTGACWGTCHKGLPVAPDVSARPTGVRGVQCILVAEVLKVPCVHHRSIALAVQSDSEVAWPNKDFILRYCMESTTITTLVHVTQKPGVSNTAKYLPTPSDVLRFAALEVHSLVVAWSLGHKEVFAWALGALVRFAKFRLW